MGHSFVRNYIHLVFGTKHRRKMIGDDVRHRLHGYSIAILVDHGCEVIAINSMEDHIHVLYDLHRSASITGTASALKTKTSYWLKKQDAALWDFQWQGGYGAFPVLENGLGIVSQYIKNQQIHHRNVTWENEYTSLLTKAGHTWTADMVWG